MIDLRGCETSWKALSSKQASTMKSSVEGCHCPPPPRSKCHSRRSFAQPFAAPFRKRITRAQFKRRNTAEVITPRMVT